MAIDLSDLDYHSLPEGRNGDPMPGLDGLTFISTGAAPTCDACGLADLDDANDDPERYDTASEPFFSWAACDACRSTLGGDRHPAHARNHADDLVHLSVCTDCLYRIAGI